MASTAQNVKGFVGARSLNGGTDVCITLPVTASAGTTYFIGDPVTLKTTGKVDTVSAASTNILGIVQGVFKENSSGQPAPLTFNQPSTGNYLGASQAGFVTVNVDPGKTYLVEIDGTASAALIGANAFVSAGTPTSAAGRSGYSLQKAVTTSADGQFQIVGLAPTDLINGYDTNYFDANGKGVVEVKINSAAFGSNKAGI